jgi:S-formylglutathione hydrolase FrmB
MRMLTKYINHCIVQVGGVFHHYLPFVCCESKKDNLFSGFEKHSQKSFVSQSGSSTLSYPVIYLLHGINGNEFNYFNPFTDFFDPTYGSLPSLIDNGLADKAIIVLVNGGARSFYNDWSDNTDEGPSSSFPIMSESVIMEDVIPFVDANFRTIASRNGRAIEGFSMGGRGAIKLAFKYPDQFCSTIAYAGATFEAIPPSAGATFPYLGPYEDSADLISTITANNAAAILASGLKIRLVDGAGDGAAGQGGGSPALSSQLTSLGIPHEFVASQSGVTAHDWAQYHRATGSYGLNFHFSCFAAAQNSTPPLRIAADLLTFLPLTMKPTAVSAGSCS